MTFNKKLPTLPLDIANLLRCQVESCNQACALSLHASENVASQDNQAINANLQIVGVHGKAIGDEVSCTLSAPNADATEYVTYSKLGLSTPVGVQEVTLFSIDLNKGDEVTLTFNVVESPYSCLNARLVKWEVHPSGSVDMTIQFHNSQETFASQWNTLVWSPLQKIYRALKVQSIGKVQKQDHTILWMFIVNTEHADLIHAVCETFRHILMKDPRVLQCASESVTLMEGCKLVICTKEKVHMYPDTVKEIISAWLSKEWPKYAEK